MGQCFSSSAKHSGAPVADKVVHIVTVAKGGTDVSGSAGTPGDHDNDSAYDSTFATCHDDAAKNWRPACGADPGKWHPSMGGKPWDLMELGPPGAPNGETRHLTYKAMGLSDAPPCAEIDVVLKALCLVFQAPYASLALYTEGRCWLVNTVAMPGGNLAWRVSACPWNLLVPQPQTLVCGDLKEDSRFADQPWTLSGLRCYCSAPLLATNGHRLGTICFMDKEPRLVDAGMCRVLNNFGEIAVRVLERHVGLAQRLQAARMAVPPHLARLQLAASTGLPDAATGTLALPGPEFGYWGSNNTNSKISALNSRNSASSKQAGLSGKPGTPTSVGPAAASAALSEKSAPAAAANSRGSTGSARDSAHNSAGTATDVGAPPSLPEDAVPEDVLVMNAFWRQLRNQERTFEACVLLVDTSKPGWPVIFADETWRLWSGYSRDHIVGRPLSDLVSPAALSVAPPAWGAMQLEAARGCRFLVPGMVAVVPEGVTATPFSGSTPAGATLSVNKQTGKPSSKGMAKDLDDPFAKKGKDKAGEVVQAEHGGRFDSANGSTATEVLLEQVMESERAQQPPVKSQGNPPASLLDTGNSSLTSGPHTSRMAAHSSVSAATHSGSSISQGPKGRIFDLSFRPAALDLLDADTLPLGMPSFVPMSACTEVLGLYAVRLHNPTDIAPPQAVLMPTAKVKRSSDAMPVHLAPKFFPGLKLSQVLGSGGYGTAYFGNWHDTDVVVKVQDHTLKNTEAMNEAQLEISLGQLLSHPNLVRTLAHAAAEMPAPVQSKLKGPSGSTTRSGRTPPGPRTPPPGTPGPAPAPPPSPLAPPAPVSQGPAFGSAGDEAPLANELMAAMQQGHDEFEWTSGYDEADPNMWFSNCDPSGAIRRGPPLLRPPTAQMSGTLEGSALSSRQPSFPAGTVAGGGSFLAPLDELKPMVGGGPGGKAAGEVVNTEDVKLNMQHPPGNTAGPGGDTSSGSTLAGNMQYVPMAVDGTAQAPGQHVPIAKAPADAIWYSVPMQMPGMPLLEAHQDRAAHSALPAPAAGPDAMTAIHIPGDTSSGGLAGAGMTFINMAGQQPALHAPAIDPNSPADSGKNFHGFDTRDSSKASSPAFLHNAGTSKGNLHHPSKASGFNSGLMRTQMSEMRTASEIALSSSNGKAPRFPMKIRTFALLEFCDGGSLQDAVDRGWLRHGSCSLLQPINLPKVIKLALDIANGLAYLHMRGVVHADLSANNILLCRVKPSADPTTSLTGKVPGGSSSNSKSQGAVLKAQGIVEPRQTSHNSHETSAGSGAKGSPPGCGAELTAAAAACATPSVNSINTTVAVTPPATRFMIAPAMPRAADDMEFTGKISDFGKSQILGPEGIIRAGGYATVTHMAPEVLSDHLLSPEADMYSFGVLLWQMMTGSRPWAGLGHSQILRIVTSGALELEWPEAPAGSFDSETWKGIVAVGTACLARKREDRPSAEEVQTKLTALLQAAPLVGDL